MEGQETCPLPDDPTLAAMARALNDAGYWAVIVDRNWVNLYMTDAQRLSHGGLLELAAFAAGAHYYSPESLTALLEGRGRLVTLEAVREHFEALGPYMLAAAEGGREELRELVDPRVRDIVDQLSPADLVNALSVVAAATYSAGMRVETPITLVPVRDSDGQLVGTVMLRKPAASMAVLGAMAAGGDLRHFERMEQVAKPDRRPAAILFADLESSSSLARRLSTASYFSLGRRMARAADQAVIDAGGLVGRHVGDGVVAFFLAESAGSESAAARSCIEAARNVRDAMSEVAVRSDLAPEQLLHALRPALGGNAVCRPDHHQRPCGGHSARRRGQRGRAYRGLRHRRARSGLKGAPGAPGRRGRGRARTRPGPHHVHASGRPCYSDREGTPGCPRNRRLRGVGPRDRTIAARRRREPDLTSLLRPVHAHTRTSSL